MYFFFSSRRRHTRCALVTGVKTCALPIWRSRSRADSADLKQVDLGAAIHLALHQLEPGDLTFGLSVGPGRYNRRAHGGTVTNDAVGEGSDEARLGLLDPGIQVASGLPADDDMEAGDEVTGGDQEIGRAHV